MSTRSSGSSLGSGVAVQSSPEISEVKILYKGWLVKQGPPPWKNWRKRWTVLTEDSIDYYKSAKTSTTGLQGSIGLSIVCSVQLEPKGKRKHGFSVTTGVRTYYFAASNEKSSEMWVEKIRNAHADFKDNKRVTIASIRHKQAKRKPTASELFESSGAVPSDDELSGLSKKELLELLRSNNDAEEEAIEQIRELYNQRLADLTATLVEREVAAITQRYAVERRDVIAEIDARRT